MQNVALFSCYLYFNWSYYFLIKCYKERGTFHKENEEENTIYN